MNMEIIMSKVHNLYDLRFAQKVCEDIPKIQQKLDEMVQSCYPFMEYRDVGELCAKIIDTKVMLDIQYKHYKEILDNKGRTQ